MFSFRVVSPPSVGIHRHRDIKCLEEIAGQSHWKNTSENYLKVQTHQVAKANH